MEGWKVWMWSFSWANLSAVSAWVRSSHSEKEEGEDGGDAGVLVIVGGGEEEEVIF